MTKWVSRERRLTPFFEPHGQVVGLGHCVEGPLTDRVAPGHDLSRRQSVGLFKGDHLGSVEAGTLDEVGRNQQARFALGPVSPVQLTGRILEADDGAGGVDLLHSPGPGAQDAVRDGADASQGHGSSGFSGKDRSPFSPPAADSGRRPPDRRHGEPFGPPVADSGQGLLGHGRHVTEL